MNITYQDRLDFIREKITTDQNWTEFALRLLDICHHARRGPAYRSISKEVLALASVLRPVKRDLWIEYTPGKRLGKQNTEYAQELLPDYAGHVLSEIIYQFTPTELHRFNNDVTAWKLNKENTMSMSEAPKMVRKIGIIVANPDSYDIVFKSDAETVLPLSKFGILRGSSDLSYTLHVDHRYDFDEVLAFVNSLNETPPAPVAPTHGYCVWVEKSRPDQPGFFLWHQDITWDSAYIVTTYLFKSRSAVNTEASIRVNEWGMGVQCAHSDKLPEWVDRSLGAGEIVFFAYSTEPLPKE